MNEWAGYIDDVKTVVGIAKDGAGFLKDARTAFDAMRRLAGNPDKKVSDPDILGLISTFTEKLVDAQLAQSQVLNALQELERAVEQAQRLHDERSRYELQATATGALVLALKPGDPKAEPPHYLCADCLEEGKKRILQPLGYSTGTLECNGCKQTFRFVVSRPHVSGGRDWGF
jgi:hypothetical protein